MDADAFYVPPRQFEVVVAVEGDDFEVMGVFSKREDAEKFKHKLNEDPIYMKSASIDAMTMDQLKRHLVADRLGQLAAPIKALAEWAGKR